MRITGGMARGILLDVPNGAEFLRPATDFLREAVFSSIGHGVRKAFVLDLFAGVGSYGLEAISRGADACIFVEKNRLAVDSIGNNVKRVKKAVATDFSTRIFCQDVFAWSETCNAEFDIIFIDPPYGMVETRGGELLTTWSKFLKNSENSRIVMEVPGSFDVGMPPGTVELRRLGRQGNSRQPNAIVCGKSEAHGKTAE
jgi:16S rRNA (guanine966-N2)-methyltransferase